MIKIGGRPENIKEFFFRKKINMLGKEDKVEKKKQKTKKYKLEKTLQKQEIPLFDRIKRFGQK